MAAHRTLALLSLPLFALAACTTGSSPVQVTRFNLGQPIAPGSIAAEPRDPVVAKSLQFGVYAQAVQAQLAHIGFTPAEKLSQSELVAVIDVNQGFREGPPRGPAFSIGIGGASFGRHSAIGGGVDLPVTRPRGTEMIGTELGVQIKRRSDGTIVWEGRARFETRSTARDADPDIGAHKLAAALFTGFPGESGRTITVP
jgi:hypothetical protein